ncbi:hypothetical protein M569_15785 [Genlisea aurea]|uniref:EDR1/CTR1/ARMC3-like peptidase-like domain-containing protein n=1 Tax=Genlisea aurea TaxID=192259 RepID=S8C3R3_9LAMI|nr:hypothetical protein M569_15785 [Genlisea aurea]
MSKVKHLLRKLHIGDHQHHGRASALDASAQSSSLQQSNSTSPSFDLPPQSTLSSESENSNQGTSFSFLEEEFQMQLALAISVSDQGRSGVDSETAQIDAAKQISLGNSPSENLGEFMSLRFRCYNVLNYDEKVIDGFYDVCGMDSTLDAQSRIPSLLELDAISVLEDVGFEVVLVNRAVDVNLRQLEERVYFMSLECNSLDEALNTSFLVQKIADLIVEKMGGSVVDVEDIFRRWRARNQELKLYFNTSILPLGSLDIGHSRQRALLFKVLADRINLPCKLVKGSYYTGTDDGAVNLIKLDDGCEYIVDLMGAPGTLIPCEVPGPPLLEKEVITDGRNTSVSSMLSEPVYALPTISQLDSNPPADLIGKTTEPVNSSTERLKSDHPENGFRALSSTCNSTGDRPDKSLGEFLFKLESREHEPASNDPGEQNMLTVTRNKMTLNDVIAAAGTEVDSSENNALAVPVSLSDESNAARIQNMQIEQPELTGVAEILWEDLQIGERIGIGSYGEVHRAEWNGTV